MTLESTQILTATGMLATAETIEMVATVLEEYNIQVTVIDPVCRPVLRNCISNMPR